MIEAKTDFHPELEAHFDQCQSEPVTLAQNGTEYTLLSVSAFDAIIEASLFKASDIPFQRVDRGEKPGVIILKKKTHANLTQIKAFLAS